MANVGVHEGGFYRQLPTANHFFHDKNTDRNIRVFSIAGLSESGVNARHTGADLCSCPELVVRECELMGFVDEIRVFAKCVASILSWRLERMGRALEFSMIICFSRIFFLTHPAGMITGLLKENEFEQFAKETSFASPYIYIA